MDSEQRWGPRRIAVAAFVVATVASLLVGVVGYGDPWSRAIITAVGTGIGVSLVFYLYFSVMDESATAD